MSAPKREKWENQIDTATLEEFRRLFMLSLDMLCVAGFDGYFKLLNPEWEQTLGYSIEELLAKPYVEFVHPDDREATFVEMDKLSGGLKVLRFRNRYRAKDGSYRWLSWKSTPDPEQQLIYAIARDITEIRQNEEALRAAHIQAEDATRAKSEFLANMSHEIRTPINAIIGMTDLALKSKLTRVQRQHLKTVKQSAMSLLALVGDILDLSKVEARKLKIDRVEFRLSEILDETIGMLALRAKQKGLALSCAVRAGAPEFLAGDPNRLRQVLVNLIANGIKFTREGSVSVEVLAESVGSSEAVLRFSVSDTGVGIPEDKQKIIFDAFTQSDRSIAQQYGGTGLGLTISSQLVQLMGGRMWVESRVGAGSSFVFTLTFGLAAEPTAKAAEAAAPHGASGLSILVAEDNPVIRKLVAALLRKKRHRVNAVSDGAAALSALEKKTFDVVLMDLEMPKLNGFETIARIREQEKKTGRRLAIVAMSGHGMEEHREQAAEAGFDCYVTKPVQIEDIERAIERAKFLSGIRGDRKLACGLIDLFLADLPKLVLRIQRAISRGDAIALREAAHALKGAIGNFKKGPAFEAARRLEHLGRGHDLTEAAEALSALKSEWSVLKASLEDMKKEFGD